MRDPVTIAWTVLAAVGVIVQTILLFDSVLTLRSANQSGVRALVSVAWGHLRSGVVYLIVHALFLTVGLAVIFLWNLGSFVSWAFLVAAGLLIFAGVADYVQRILFRRRNP